MPMPQKVQFLEQMLTEAYQNTRKLTRERNDLGYSNHLVDLKESRKKAIEAFSNFSK